MLENTIEILTILAILLPVLLRIFALLAQETNHKKMNNLAERATIVVTALEQSGLSNFHKKNMAYDKLARYANEVGIKVTEDQLDDYIESAVIFMKKLQETK